MRNIFQDKESKFFKNKYGIIYNELKLLKVIKLHYPKIY